MAEKYNITDYRGSVYVFEDNAFTGKVIPCLLYTSSGIHGNNEYISFKSLTLSHDVLLPVSYTHLQYN